MTGKDLHYVKLPQAKKHRCATIHVKSVSSDIKFLYRPYQLCSCMEQKVTSHVSEDCWPLIFSDTGYYI